MESTPEEFSTDFDSLVSGLGNLVGENELEARKALGDARYEQMVSFVETANILGLRKEQAYAKYLESKGFLYGALGAITLLSGLMGIAWSFYFWFS
jgi:hypothetical protein